MLKKLTKITVKNSLIPKPEKKKGIEFAKEIIEK